MPAANFKHALMSVDVCVYDYVRIFEAEYLGNYREITRCFLLEPLGNHLC